MTTPDRDQLDWVGEPLDLMVDMFTNILNRLNHIEKCLDRIMPLVEKAEKLTSSPFKPPAWRKPKP